MGTCGPFSEMYSQHGRNSRYINWQYTSDEHFSARFPRWVTSSTLAGKTIPWNKVKTLSSVEQLQVIRCEW